jgi:hypothetical protein
VPVLNNARLTVIDKTNQQQVERFLLPKPNGAYTDADVKAIISYYLDQAPPLLLDPLLPIAQMCLETAYLSAAWAARPKCNPAGIGVTGAAGAGISFGSWHNSVPAHLGRLVAYAVLPANRTPVQKAAVENALAWRTLPLERQGQAQTLDKLAGFWAADQYYATKIANIANAILKA